ncbi:hypothetical protein OnM2_062036 [Erysiphe neolycopersici]|uniref:Uncharacterized protein n=1 Tax=Erysiphe neolycopersici TaxID=212602 RepID=A0A420HP27_9PEZI|nr:hypothetical protein OnM2_062036 [Erysiphe neolycopersici]
MYQCKAIPDEIALSMVSRISPSENDDGSIEEALEKVLVRSFSDENIAYNIFLDKKGLISKCECLKISLNHVVCMHMFIASRILGYGSCFSTNEVVSSSSTEDPNSAAQLKLTKTSRHEEI